MKTSVGCPPAKKVKLYIATPNRRLVSANANSIVKLAGASSLEFVDGAASIPEKTVSQVTETSTVFVPLGELVDVEKERERLHKELERVSGEIARADGKLNNRGFLEKAPKNLVEGERAKRDKFIEMKAKIERQIAELDA